MDEKVRDSQRKLRKSRKEGWIPRGIMRDDKVTVRE